MLVIEGKSLTEIREPIHREQEGGMDDAPSSITSDSPMNMGWQNHYI